MNIDEIIGIETYATRGEGVGGIIKCQVEDFVVEEITNRTEGDSGKYLIVEVEKTNWDTHKLIRDLSRKLRVSQNRFGWAGTKDKRAVTRQKISIWDVAGDEIKNIYLKDVSLRVIGRSNKQVSLGDLYANRFHITLRKIHHASEETRQRVDKVTGELSALGGAPNFFGVQRFGDFRPITHLVGKSIVGGDFEQAVMTYLTKVYPGEQKAHQEARRCLAESRDFKEGLKVYPVHLTFERAMIHHLATNPGDYTGALGVLSENLQRMFVHAYQSYLFNLILSRRITRGLPLNSAVEGDIVCFKNAAGLPDASRTQKVTAGNLKGVNNLVKRGRAFITAPLIGYETPLATGEPGEIEQQIIAEHDVDIGGFKVPGFSKFASKGLRREILINTSIAYKVEADELNNGCTSVTFDFTLQKGSYATVLLREYMKVISDGV